MSRTKTKVLLDAVAVDGDSVSIPCDRWDTAGYVIVISGSATCTLYSSVDYGANWTSESAATSSESAVISIKGKNKLKATVSSWSSGTVTCSVMLDDADADEDTSVPAADSSSNVTMSDVIGNKDDTTSGDSIVSLVKTADAAIDTVDTVVDGIAANQDVPSADSADNDHVSDVVGNKTDTTGGDSIVSLVKTVDSVADSIETKVDTLTTNVATVDTVVDGIATDQSVPSADSADNAKVSDVVGNKTDTTGGDSLVALVKTVDGVVDTINTNNPDLVRENTHTYSSVASTGFGIKAIGTGTCSSFSVTNPSTLANTASETAKHTFTWRIGDATNVKTGEVDAYVRPGHTVVFPATGDQNTYDLTDFGAVPLTDASATLIVSKNIPA